MIIQLLTHYTKSIFKSLINQLCDISRCNTQSNLSKISFPPFLTVALLHIGNVLTLVVLYCLEMLYSFFAFAISVISNNRSKILKDTAKVNYRQKNQASNRHIFRVFGRLLWETKKVKKNRFQTQNRFLSLGKKQTKNFECEIEI